VHTRAHTHARTHTHTHTYIQSVSKIGYGIGKKFYYN
jgi:hypothetical protein